MRGMRAFALALILFACSSPAKPTAPPKPTPNPELSAALEPLAWWLGDWEAESGATGTEHWVAASGAIYGVALQDSGFELMIIDDDDGPKGELRMLAMPAGQKSVTFHVTALGMRAATFANPTHDFPKSITYEQNGDHLAATIGGAGKSESYRFKRITAPRSRTLEHADKAFAADVAARGLDGWVAAFEPAGGMMTGNGRVEGAEGIRKAMAPVLTSTSVEWAPIASAMRGDLGYTVGKAKFENAEDSWRSTYVTIWRKQPDGTWKVLFDTGRVAQE